MEKMRIGVVFGGTSREREVSFAGGRTVYDNLDKNLFNPIPLFIDSFGNFILLNWEFIYKGSIRDFYPPAEVLPESRHHFQVYAESLSQLDDNEQLKLINKIGSRVEPGALSSLIDMAFLCLHGSDGEDGRIQGLLEFLRIPYTGSGILSSSIGMNKSIQKKLMKDAGFNLPNFVSFQRSDYKSDRLNEIYQSVRSKIGFPYVVKPANQGSSLGVSFINKDDFALFKTAVERSLFIQVIKLEEWDKMNFDQRVQALRELCDLKEGIGMPVMIENRIIRHPEELLSVLNHLFAERENEVVIQGIHAEEEVLVEAFIEGKEFSCIVIQDEDGNPLALPPTEIRKGAELFDYRSKYLPGFSRKITPINIPEEQINLIRSQCESLFIALHFNVYARIDGFITSSGEVLLNDPNTTSGMMPSSFFFHQAAEIGLNPSQFITYIIRTSLHNRIRDFKDISQLPKMLRKLDEALKSLQSTQSEKTRIAVMLGGFSSERHISVESGRNVYEKLSSSEKYDPVPVFVSGTSVEHVMHRIPVNILLKDNADDILEKIEHYSVHPVINEIIYKAQGITSKYSSAENVAGPIRITYENLAELVDGVFIALHGRPGEDGAVQEQLLHVGLPYNGSGPSSSRITIDKYQTNELLAKNGFLVAKHQMAFEKEWYDDADVFYEHITRHFSYPFICKPNDDGCSSAVKIVRNKEQLIAYTSLTFRGIAEMDISSLQSLNIGVKEEFPSRKSFLVEELITAQGAPHFMEITGGMLTGYDEKGNCEYEIFEASEALSEGDVLSLEEKFLAGEGQNITPARYSKDSNENKILSTQVKVQFGKVARLLNIEGYARIDAFVRIYGPLKVEVIFIEVNSLPGMTPATCIFHQAAIAHYKPFEYIDKILTYGFKRKSLDKVLN